MSYGLKKTDKCPTCNAKLIKIADLGLVELGKCPNECGHKEAGVEDNNSPFVNITVVAPGSIRKEKA